MKKAISIYIILTSALLSLSFNCLAYGSGTKESC